MELTQEEKAALRELLGKVRQVAEDFCCVYVNHFLQSAPEHRLRVLKSAMDGGELLLGRLQSFVTAIDNRSESVPPFENQEAAYSEMNSTGGYLRDCFYWAAERCLGQDFTPIMRVAYYKMINLVLARRSEMPDSLREQMDIDHIPGRHL
jgi:predicted AAA+ superfamily ATPase